VKQFSRTRAIKQQSATDGRRDFFGTGHGLGLEIHEFPRFQKTVFKIGQVQTVEPGLYYPGLGGVRTEDVVAITKSGIRMLSRFQNQLEL
jgi:Xaa-Pro aminopeptidase